MKTYKCGMCKEEIVAVKENKDGIVYFDEKYWHHDCFIQECNRRIKSGKSKKYDWQEALDSISKWQEQASANLKLASEKDDVFNFIISHYRVSRTNKNMFERLSYVYDGSYPGLLYPIPPDELLAEWEYYIQYLRDARKYKNMTDTEAIPYDLAILLSKNVEFREMMEKRKLEAQAREAQRSAEVVFNENALNAMRRNNSKKCKVKAETQNLHPFIY